MAGQLPTHDHLPMLHERGNTQRLSQQVSWLLFSVNGKDTNQSRLDPFTEVVVFLVDMMTSISVIMSLGHSSVTFIEEYVTL
jgi:hypothetical protein